MAHMNFGLERELILISKDYVWLMRILIKIIANPSIRIFPFSINS